MARIPDTRTLLPVAGLLQRIAIVLGMAWLAVLSIHFIRRLATTTAAAEAPVV